MHLTPQQIIDLLKYEYPDYTWKIIGNDFSGMLGTRTPNTCCECNRKIDDSEIFCDYCKPNYIEEDN